MNGKKESETMTDILKSLVNDPNNEKYISDLKTSIKLKKFLDITFKLSDEFYSLKKSILDIYSFDENVYEWYKRYLDTAISKYERDILSQYDRISPLEYSSVKIDEFMLDKILNDFKNNPPNPPSPDIYDLPKNQEKLQDLITIAENSFLDKLKKSKGFRYFLNGHELYCSNIFASELFSEFFGLYISGVVNNITKRKIKIETKFLFDHLGYRLGKKMLIINGSIGSYLGEEMYTEGKIIAKVYSMDKDFKVYNIGHNSHEGKIIIYGNNPKRFGVSSSCKAKIIFKNRAV